MWRVIKKSGKLSTNLVVVPADFQFFVVMNLFSWTAWELTEKWKPDIISQDFTNAGEIFWFYYFFHACGFEY